jgi:hypothetical protein
MAISSRSQRALRSTITHIPLDLVRAVRGGPLASAGVCGGCYSFSYSPPPEGSVVATDPSLAMRCVVRDVTPTVGHGLGRRLRCWASAESSAAAVPGSVGRYPSGMSNAISGLLGAIVGGLAAIAGAWLQARNAARLQREAAEQQEERRRAENRQLLARRYLYQLGDAVDSFLHRVDNWAHRGGPRYAEGLHPGYWEITSLYVVARALAAERILALQGVYVELQALSSSEDANLPPRAVEEAVRRAFGQGLFYYHRLALAEAALDRSGDEFRLLIYSEFLRRYEDPEWNLKSFLDPVRQAFNSLNKERLEKLGQSLAGLRERIEELTASPNTNGIDTVVTYPS